MKCIYCGGEVGLEENFCPYCGRPNEQAQRHHQEMADYRQRYAETEAAVVGKVKHYAQIVPRVVAILLLLVAVVVMFWVTENAYAFPDEIRRRAAEKHPQEVMAQLDGYLKDRDYLGFVSFFNYNGIRIYGSAFVDYTDVEWCAEDYKGFLLQLEQLFLNKDYESWLKYSAADDIRRLCMHLDEFEDTYTDAQRDTQLPLHQAAMDDMRDTMRDMLRIYLGIGDEELESFLSLSENQKAARIEEVLLGA